MIHFGIYTKPQYFFSDSVNNKLYKDCPKPDSNCVDFWKGNCEKYPIIFDKFQQHI